MFRSYIALLGLIAVSGCTSYMQDGADIQCARVPPAEEKAMACLKKFSKGVHANNPSVQFIYGAAIAMCKPDLDEYLAANRRCIRNTSYVPGKGPKLSQSEAQQKSYAIMEKKITAVLCGTCKKK